MFTTFIALVALAAGAFVMKQSLDTAKPGSTATPTTPPDPKFDDLPRPPTPTPDPPPKQGGGFTAPPGGPLPVQPLPPLPAYDLGPCRANELCIEGELPGGGQTRSLALVPVGGKTERFEFEVRIGDSFGAKERVTQRWGLAAHGGARVLQSSDVGAVAGTAGLSLDVQQFGGLWHLVLRSMRPLAIFVLVKKL